MATKKRIIKTKKEVSDQNPWKWVAVAVLALLVLVNIALIAQVFAGFSLAGHYRTQLSANSGVENELKQRILDLEFDRVRIEDATNILLAVQDYQFEKDDFPRSLQELRDQEYLSARTRLKDPVTDVPYFYQKQNDENFVLCVWLSDMIKGTNTTRCPDGTESIVFDEDFTVDVTDDERFSDTVLEEIKEKENVADDELITEVVTDGWLAIIDSDGVRVRKEPTTKSAMIASVYKGERLPYDLVEGVWYRVTLPWGAVGWVHGSFIDVI